MNQFYIDIKLVQQHTSKSGSRNSIMPLGKCMQAVGPSATLCVAASILASGEEAVTYSQVAKRRAVAMGRSGSVMSGFQTTGSDDPAHNRVTVKRLDRTGEIELIERRITNAALILI